MLTGLKKKIKFFCKRHQTSDDKESSKFQLNFDSRCYVTMIVKIVTSASLVILNHESFQQASKIMCDEKADQNATCVNASTDILTYILIVLAVCRVPLFLYACKDRRAVKAFFFYETAIEMTGHFVPQRVYADLNAGAQTWILMTMANFVLLYSNFWLSLAASLLSLVTFQTGTYVVYARDLEVDVLVSNIIVLLIWLVLTLGLIHKFTLMVAD